MASPSRKRRDDNEARLAQNANRHAIYKEKQYGIQFRYFNDLKIHNDLQNSKQFCQALSMVEDLIDNDNLCCYYSYVCNIDLRYKNIFNFEDAKKVIEQTRMFIVNLCKLIEFQIGNLSDEYSIFHGDPFVSDCYRDYIVLDRTLINGFCVNQIDSNARSYMEVFFVFTKLLHELSHALTYHCGRVYLPNEKDINIRFETPKTHCLQGESGNSIERLLFGSVIDAPGRTHNDKYIIQYLILSDGRISGVIDQIWISSFVKDALNMHKLRTMDSIVPIPFKFLTKTLKRKLEGKPNDCRTKRTCQRYNNLVFDWDDIDGIEYGQSPTTFKA